jgi:branched-chain amino acid transport system ATP-binding protein
VEKHAVTLVLVEHLLNIPKVIGLVDTVWSLSKGREAKEGNKLSIGGPTNLNCESEKRLTPLKQLLLHVPGGNSKMFDDLPGGARISTAGVSDADTVLEVSNLKVKRGIRTIFGGAHNSSWINNDGISISLKRGQISILEAPNGWGKSTLLDTIAGLRDNNLNIISGRISLKGEEISSIQTHQIVRMGLAYLRANQQVFCSLDVKEQRKLAGPRNLSFNCLDENRKGGDLSGGEKQKLLIDLLPEAEVYLLDEPLVGLDEDAIEKAYDVIKYLIKDQKAILITIPSTTYIV